jgi:hypothetical protein
MSRCQLREKPRQNQLFKVASMRVPVRTAYPEIASGGNAQTQCPTRRRIRNTLGPWMTVHLQDTLVVEIGMPFPLVPVVINPLNPNCDSPAKTCLRLTRLPRQSVTCVKCTFVVLACSIAALPSVLQVPIHRECQTLVTSSNPPRCTSASTATLSRLISCSTILAPSIFRHGIYTATLVFHLLVPDIFAPFLKSHR